MGLRPRERNKEITEQAYELVIQAFGHRANLRTNEFFKQNPEAVGVEVRAAGSSAACLEKAGEYYKDGRWKG